MWSATYLGVATREGQGATTGVVALHIAAPGARCLPASPPCRAGKAIMSDLVRCYSGTTYAQEPLSFVWGAREHAVAHIESTRRVLDRDSGQATLQLTDQSSS